MPVVIYTNATNMAQQEIRKENGDRVRIKSKKTAYDLIEYLQRENLLPAGARVAATTARLVEKNTNPKTLESLEYFFTQLYSLKLISPQSRLCIQLTEELTPVFNLVETTAGFKVFAQGEEIMDLDHERIRQIRKVLKTHEGEQKAKNGEIFLIRRMNRLINECMPKPIGTGAGFVEIDLAQLEKKAGADFDPEAREALLEAMFDRIQSAKGNNYILLNADKLSDSLRPIAQRRLAKVRSQSRNGQVLEERPEGAIVSRIVFAQKGDVIEKAVNESVVALWMQGLPNTGLAFLQAELHLAGIWSEHAQRDDRFRSFDGI